MTVLHWIDGIVILLFFAMIFFITLRYAGRAGRDTQQFFLSGRNLPWYVAGTAMVATTFAADTPLAVTELVAQNGIAGNWLWWNMALGAVLTVFFFAKLWRRSGMMTDVEFLEFRYSGRPAAFLRGFRAIYLGLFMNVIVLAWVHKAMEKIFRVVLPGVNPFLLVALVAGFILFYATVSGLLGSARTDSMQFVFAMAGCIVLSIIVIRSPGIGGLSALKDQLAPHVISFFPKVGRISAGNAAGGALALSAGALAAHVGLQWWSSWYPGADPGGGGYVAQRMLSAKNEKHSFYATLWFTIAHYTVRPWPWILVALAALVLLPRSGHPDDLRAQDPVKYEIVSRAYPDWSTIDKADDPDLTAFYENYENTVDPGILYPKMMVRCLPRGWLGLLIAVFLAAYISTLAAQLNWGTSYLIHDFYRRFIRPDAPERHLVWMSRAIMACLTGLSLLIAGKLLTTISGAWIFIINASAGLGGVLILRWYWWRINAWSEITAMIMPLVLYPLAVTVMSLKSPLTLYPVVLGSTAVWIVVTLLTRPVDPQRLQAFYDKIRPPGPGWRFQAGDARAASMRPLLLTGIQWICGVVMVYASLFGLGFLIFHAFPAFLACLIMVLLAGAGLFLLLRKDGR
ncbi:Na+:solute symporter [bacterium]|nr:Na+:solute symporter [bacterium]